MNLVHLIVRQWRQRPARTALSIASVAIAVAAVLGIALAQASVRLAFRELLAVTEGRPAVEIVAIEGGRFDAARVPRMDDLEGVRVASPMVTRATLARVSGKRFRAVLLGVPAEEAEVQEALPLVKGTWCRKPRQALVSADLAKSLKIDVGDRLIVLGRRGPHAAKIVGLVNSAALRELAPTATLVTPIGEVQQLYGLGNQINRVRVVLESSDSRDTVQVAVGARLPEDLVVQAPVGQMELAGGVLRSTELALRFAGALSMAMAVLIVVNTLRMNFGERRRDMAVLRVLGATSRQLVGLHLIEGLVLGFLGAVLGVPAGLALGRGLAALMQRLAEAEITNPEIPYWTIAAALVVGPLVAGAAALVPALRSRGISPVEALGDVETRRGERFPWWSIICGSAVWTLAVVLLILVTTERLAAGAAIPAGVLMLLGFVAVIPAVLAPIIRSVAGLLAPWTKMEGGFAAEQLLERPTRTGLTVGVLVVAISTGVGMGNAIINNVNDVRSWYRRMTAADIMLTGPSTAEGAVESRNGRNIRQTVEAQPGVEFVVETRFFPARASGVPALCIVHEIDPRLELLWSVTQEEDRYLRSGLNAGDVVVGSVLARRLGLGTGDVLRLEIQGRVLSLRICGTVRDYAQGGLVVFLNQAAAAELIEVGPAHVYSVSTRPGLPIGPLVEQLTALLDEEGLVIRSFAEFRQQLDLLVGGIVAALWGLLIIGFVVGGFAVANTLSMSVFEQTRELGLLRVIGMTRRQVRKLILYESLLLGILGVLMGTLAGLTTAWIIHLCNEPLLGYSIPFTLHTWLVVANAVTCLAITMLAAWLPGERAARLDFLAAIAYE